MSLEIRDVSLRYLSRNRISRDCVRYHEQKRILKLTLSNAFLWIFFALSLIDHKTNLFADKMNVKSTWNFLANLRVCVW